MSKSFLRTQKSENFGGRQLLQQQKNAHCEKLGHIYSNTKGLFSFNQLKTKRYPFMSKKEAHDCMQHQRNIENLYKFISRPKNMADRFKDPNDFFAYPAFFRRQVETKKIKRNNKLKRVKSQNKFNCMSGSNISSLQKKYGIDITSVKQHLPLLQEFNREQIEEYADSLTRLIFNYNLNSKERLDFLKECAIRVIPDHYPTNFAEVVEQIFSEISQSLGLS